jgi:hypothetical protein
MKKKKVSRARKKDLSHAESMLPKAQQSTDNAITCINTENHEEALRMLASASQCQNIVLGNLCTAIDKLHKALQKLED